jgi:acyl-CoA thioesterase
MATLLSDPDALLTENGELSFKLDGWIDTAPFEDLIGIKLDQVGEGKALLSCQARVKLAQGGGVVHGGVLTTLADTAVAMAIKSLLPAGTVFATTELQMRFLAPVRSGLIRASAEVSGPQGRTFHGRATIFDEVDVKVAEFTSVFRVARNQPDLVEAGAES